MGFWTAYMGIEGGGGDAPQSFSFVACQISVTGTTTAQISVTGTSKAEISITGTDTAQVKGNCK